MYPCHLRDAAEAVVGSNKKKRYHHHNDYPPQISFPFYSTLSRTGGTNTHSANIIYLPYVVFYYRHQSATLIDGGIILVFSHFYLIAPIYWSLWVGRCASPNGTSGSFNYHLLRTHDMALSDFNSNGTTIIFFSLFYIFQDFVSYEAHVRVWSTR